MGKIIQKVNESQKYSNKINVEENALAGWDAVKFIGIIGYLTTFDILVCCWKHSPLINALAL